MINKTKIKGGIKTLLTVFVMTCNSFFLQAQDQLGDKFKKLTDNLDMEYKIPEDYYAITGGNDSYNPHAGLPQSLLNHTIKYKKNDIVVAFALISTRIHSDKDICIREFFGNPDKIHLVREEVDSTLSKIKYLDTLLLQKVNANRGVVYNRRINNKYMGEYARCRKIEIYKDNVGRAEILFFYNKENEDLVNGEIAKTWGMLKFR